MVFILPLALAISVVSAAPFAKRQLDDPGCVASIPANPDPDTVNKVYLAAVALNVSMLVMQATMETCLQESNCNNLSCGDQDSLGAFQQRPSMGWGTPAQVQDPTYAATSFINQAIPLAAANPNAAPDVIAQGVQHAELGNLYAQRFDEANQLIQQAASATGVSWGGISGGSGGSSPAPPPPPPAAPPASGGGGGGGCSTYTAVAGDNCWQISQNIGTDVATFLSWNPSVDSVCSNLQIGTAYCTSPP